MLQYLYYCIWEERIIMRRNIKLAALLIMVAVLLSGCMDFSALQNAMQSEVDPNATPEPTMPPLTAPLFTDRDAVYEWYNQVNIGDTLESLKATYGEPTVETDQNGDTYFWLTEEGYGFAGIFWSDGVLRAKALYYEDMRQLMELSNADNLANFATLKTSHDFSMACLALGGKPCEIMAIAQDQSANPEIERVFTWIDKNGSNIQILFGANEKIKQISYAFADEVAE